MKGFVFHAQVFELFLEVIAKYIKEAEGIILTSGCL